MLEGEQEEERKRENEKKLKKERDKLEKQQREVECMLFGDSGTCNSWILLVVEGRRIRRNSIVVCVTMSHGVSDHPPMIKTGCYSTTIKGG